jgi:hypothetical protein
MESHLQQEDLIVIPLPRVEGGITYTVARLVEDPDLKVFAEAIAPVPGTRFAPPQRIALSRYSIAKFRSGALNRPDLYFYEGMIMPPPDRGAEC